MSIWPSPSASRLSPRWLFGGGALCVLAGLSYATGLTRTISGWFITVEGIDLSTDPDFDSNMAISIDRVGVALELGGGDPSSLVVTPQEPKTVEGFELLDTNGEAQQVPIRRDE